ncbi:MAG TPA: HAMP domain-containing sensor histidine kinase, partial [Gemmataceae bacterium]|nr:HAMP domain-containing sensor histidine kinase [Gemmataceae bacterium]
LGLLLLGLVGASAWTAWDSAQHARLRIAHQINGVEQTLSTETTYPLTQPVLEDIKGLSGAECLLVEPDGRRIATFSEQPDGLPIASIERGEASLGSRTLLAGRAYLCRGVILRAPHKNAGATLYVLYPESQLEEAVWQAIRPSLIVGLFGGLVAVGLMLEASWRLVRRIRDLERRTSLIAGGDFSPMPMPPRNDELRDLARSVNEMAEKLVKYQEAVGRSERARLLGQVSSGLAHQLRNAVTGAKLAVQLHEQSCSGGDHEALDVALRQLARMSADLERFFDLGKNGMHRVPCSLTELVDEAVSLLQPQCNHAHVKLVWKRPEVEVTIAGDRGQLAHMILNVLGNAVEAASPGGEVEVRLQKTEGSAAIEIFDTGRGPASEVASRLFEPFVTGKPEGIGLGLVVARQVAEAHGGGIRWFREKDRTCFRIEVGSVDTPSGRGSREIAVGTSSAG